jgi:transposase
MAWYKVPMEIPNIYHLLLNSKHFIIQDISIEKNTIRLGIESITHRAVCPECSQESLNIHSTYLRYPADLAWAEWRIILNLNVKRFFCQNDACSKRTCAERFPNFVSPYARRTQRVIKKQQRVGVNVCAHIAEKLLGFDHIGISDTTINRLIRSIPDPEILPVRVLGVDDWAKRKGQRYGTLLLDHERGQIIDLLTDRTADTLVQWFTQHPGIEIVSRDRSQTEYSPKNCSPIFIFAFPKYKKATEWVPFGFL